MLNNSLLTTLCVVDLQTVVASVEATQELRLLFILCAALGGRRECDCALLYSHMNLNRKQVLRSVSYRIYYRFYTDTFTLRCFVVIRPT